jgi:hypothetical protein
MRSNIRERVSIGEQTFTFTLCRKAEQLGPVTVDHWWMRTTDLYRQRAQRGRKGGNYEAVIEAFWALCRRAGSYLERGVQESYLLARLLPYARSQGSRRIVADAYLGPRTKAAREKRELAIQELDEFLQNCGSETTTPLTFSRQTADAIGPPVGVAELKEPYEACCAELFDSAVAVLAADKEAGVARLRAGWHRFTRSVGRRRGQPLKKQVLDILSYEARAALDRCYSAVWDMLLLPHLTQAYQLSKETVAFLRLWHLDQAGESNLGEQAYFHLFHGHAFALHPATALFLSTPTGRELVGSWLVTDCSNREFRRLLHGILVAVYHYAGLRHEAAQRRRKQPLGLGGRELTKLEKQRTKKRRRRRTHDD